MSLTEKSIYHHLLVKVSEIGWTTIRSIQHERHQPFYIIKLNLNLLLQFQARSETDSC